MHKKFLILFLFFILNLAKAQNEFITTWKPSISQISPLIGTPFPSSDSQIWLPIRGTDYNVSWEEIGYPSHTGTINNITSAYQVLVDFGLPLNPNPNDATYRVKVTNGNGIFHTVRFADTDMFNGTGLVGDCEKILKVEQWGTTQWLSMKQAFSMCHNLDIAATDLPDLSNVITMSEMFSACLNLVGNPTINDWNVSNVSDFSFLFTGCYLFNQPIGNWDTSNATNIAFTFGLAKIFNQPIANWDISNVKNMTGTFYLALEFNQPIGTWDTGNNVEFDAMFSGAPKFNQPIGSWNTSQAVYMDTMFTNAKAFNQDLSNWNTSNVIDMRAMFSGATNFNGKIGDWNTGNVKTMQEMFKGASNFNQNIGNWNVSQVKYMNDMFANANSFNQTLGNWKLNALQFAFNIFQNTSINCQNYDSTLLGWSQNSGSVYSLYLTLGSPLTYSHPAAVAARNYLISNRSWVISGDIYNAACESILSTSENSIQNEISIYPNPATDFIYVKNLDKAKNYIIFDQSGRIVLTGILSGGQINIQSLTSGNYILQVVLKDKIQSFKFIKK